MGEENRKHRHQVMLHPKVAAQLRKLGGGNLSHGIARAAQHLEGKK